MDGIIEVRVSYSTIANFSMIYNRVPLIKRIEVRNISSESLGNIKLHVSFKQNAEQTENYESEWESSIGSIPAGQYVSFDRIPLKISKELFFLTEKNADASFIITVTSNSTGEVLEEESLPLKILPRDTWIGSDVMPELLASFVTPGRNAVRLITEEASAYQSGLPEKAKEYAREIYENIRKKGPFTVTQMNPMAGSINAMEVLSRKQGTALEFSLFYASCLERAGLNPVIILLDNRVITACWLEDRTFAECVEDDISLITKRMAEGVEEIIAVDASILADKGSFEQAQESAEYYLAESSFDIFVDIIRCRGSGIFPVPERLGDEQKYTPRKTSPSQQLDPPPASYSKQRMWENKLLDLSLRNSLISYRLRRNSIQIMAADLNSLETALASGEEFQILSKPSDILTKQQDNINFPVDLESVRNLTDMEYANHRLRTYLKEDELKKQIVYIYRTTKTNMEENGANTLYLALGFLKWYESDVSEKERRAPIVLVPVELVRKSAGKGYVLRIRDEDSLVNVTLVEMLRQNFNINVTDVDPLPTAESGIDIKQVFATFRKAVIDKPRWEVENISVLGQFSFNQFIMWNDMRNRSEELMNHKVVASLISGKMEWEQQGEFQSPDTLDNTVLPNDMAVPISADSSQLSAIYASGNGLSFVLHGPPGTGKSQTITNIIANALFQGKTVLFIAEKMAALSVVQRRLESIGLGPFSLELHSNKTKKRDALSQLDEVLSIPKAMHPDDYAARAQKLFELRKELNSVISAIHSKRPIGLSLYDIITMYESTSSDKNIHFTRQQIESIDASTYDSWISVVRDISTAGAACGNVADHPLKDLGACEYSYAFRDEVTGLLNEYLEAIKDLKSPCENIQLKTYADHQILYNVLNRINSKQISRELLASCDDPSIKSNLDIIYTLCRKRFEIHEKILRVFSESVFALDACRLFEKWKELERKVIRIGQRDIVKELKGHARSSIEKEKVPAYLQLLCDYRLAGEKMWEVGAGFDKLFGSVWNINNTDWRLLNSLYSESTEIKALAASLGADAWQYIIDVDEENAQAYLNSFEKISKLTFDLSVKLALDVEVLAGDSCFEDSAKKASVWLNNIESLRAWSLFATRIKEARSLGLSNVVDEYMSGNIQSDELMSAVTKSLSRAYAEYVIDTEQSLSSFNGDIFEDEIKKYHEATEEFERLTREELVAKLSSKLPDITGSAASSSELSILRKAIRTGGRGLSIRRLFDQIPNLLKTLCPCMLMSPISVAQYIDPKFPKFDLVIFDEASQMQTCYAVGAIARGKEFIVVGDPKQLPPTSFFTINTIDEDNIEKEDLESILDDCLALSMPQEHLLWHYRSRHESLIAFSNMQFYDNKLFTFPSPNDIVSKVSLVHVDGYYDRGKTKQNKAEAKAVVEEIMRRLADPVLRNQSIGVVAFSIAQQNLIDDMLSDALDKNPELDAINISADEPIFIKNLENVQGDERDVILFSIGYGPDKNGIVRLNFGPLNREGGWRRLNVAVSRARMEMMVFSTLQPDQIDITRTNSEGIINLKSFLEFAKNGKNCLPRDKKECAGEGIEDIIAHKIEEMGYKTNVDIGSSGYRMDIGIINPDNEDEYVLGIMIDGKNKQSPSTARDRNIVQNSVLESLGWNLHHLWIMDWWYDSEKELSKIKDAIELAIKKNRVAEEEKAIDESNLRANAQIVLNVEVPETVEPETAADDKVKPEYNPADTQNMGNPEDFMAEENSGKILEQMKEIIRLEGPISYRQLQKRTLNSWGIYRPIVKINKYFEKLVNDLNPKQTNFNGKIFIWNEDQNPDTYEGYRTPTDKERRDITDIPPEEIINAIKDVVNNQFALSSSDLVREVGKVFGYSRLGNNLKAIIGECIDLSVKAGYIKSDGDRISVI